MTKALNLLESMAGAALAQENIPSPRRIREIIGAVRKIPDCSSVSDDAAEALAKEFEARHGVTMTIGAVLIEQGYEPWLEAARVNISPYYWCRYRKLLVAKGFSGQVVAMLENVTDRILGLLENPLKDGPWDRRGMVVGHVQSGKTANYTGLICKAADAGYKLIVVIAGIHNNLRNQTQLRIDEGFVGRDSARLLSHKDDLFIGVGRFDQSRRPVTFTNSIKDFNKAMATGVGIPLKNLTEPAVLVIKKNSSTLKNLLEWLKEHNARHSVGTVEVPMLLIDDEADNASINIRHGQDEVSRINGQIRDLLKMFERSCYVGYTATPFANIFIDPDSDDAMLGEDLFPRNFIISLDPPTNYFGAAKVFHDDPDRIVRIIDDNEDLLPLKHPIDTKIVSLPASLIDAIRTFVIARSVRLARGHKNPHCSMLINASRFTAVQGQIRNVVHNRLEDIKNSVRIYGALPKSQAMKDPEIESLYKVWQNEFSDTEFEWHTIQGLLNDAVAPIKAVEVNSKSPGTLNYGDYENTGLNIIAVGGYSLSRGLTLEGLMVSYFLRNSMMYDTLMQMGRWFGYRPDYEDLCRVWMPEEAEGWYSHITESIEELREELRRMEAAGATPKEFGLKVRSHPDSLIVTARNKMGSSQRIVMKIGLGNSFIETSILKRDEPSLEANRRAVGRLVERLTAYGLPISQAEAVPAGWLLRGTPVAAIVDFIAEFQNHPGSVITDTGPVRRYIEDRCENELASWDLLFTSITQGGTLIDTSLGITINCQRRAAGIKSDTRTLLITNKQRVASRGVEKTGLTTEDVKDAECKYRDHAKDKRIPKNGTYFNYPDKIYREIRKRPLFVIHLLGIGEKDDDLSHQKPVVAWSISFPRTELEEQRVEYVVNTTWLRENLLEDIEEDEMGGDND